jgi:hypothetical protein
MHLAITQAVVSATDACLEPLTKEEAGLRAAALAACVMIAEHVSKREGKNVPVWRCVQQRALLYDCHHLRKPAMPSCAALSLVATYTLDS